jgi:hypothetical protein
MSRALAGSMMLFLPVVIRIRILQSLLVFQGMMRNCEETCNELLRRRRWFKVFNVKGIEKE